MGVVERTAFPSGYRFQRDLSITSSSSTFRLMQQQQFRLVDKSDELANILSQDNKFTMCRPIKFGKTMTMSMLQALFAGEKTLFDGTVGRRMAIVDRDWDWKHEKHIVLYFNMGAIARRRDFRENLLGTMSSMGTQVGINEGVISKESVKGAIRDLIQNGAKGSPSGKVVVLIDDMDAPVSETLFLDNSNAFDPALDVNRKTLYDFLAAIAEYEEDIRLQMYMGVGYVTLPGCITDLTFDKNGMRLIGYTPKDIHDTFGDQLERLRGRLGVEMGELEQQIASWYGRYNWGCTDAPDIHNPFAINELMKRQEFGPHWSMAVGPMLWLHNYLRASSVANPFHGRLPLVSTTEFQESVKDIGSQKELDIRMILLKLGLLTVRKTETDPTTLMRTGVLGIPNIDVNEYMVQPLINSLYTRGDL